MSKALQAVLTLQGTAANFGDELALQATSDLTVIAPIQGVSQTPVTTVGANNIIQPNTDGQTYYVYVKHTGKDASGAAVTTTLNIEKTGDVIFGKLAANEFAFFPCGGAAHGIQLQASSGTIVAEYAYFTRS